MPFTEQPFMFDCEGDALLGIVALPETESSVGVLVLVGGPQYRVGSHRQFVQLSRALASRGVPCMRFDYRGMGDSTGEMRTFEDVRCDTRAAVDAFFQRTPGLRHVILWGLCDGATAAAFYGPSDPRVAGLVLLNPWVRTQEGEARTYLWHYYPKRVFERDFWANVISGRFRLSASVKSLINLVADTVARKPSTSDSEQEASTGAAPLPDRVAAALTHFGRDVLLVLSGNDYTAAEFKHAMTRTPALSRALSANRVSWEHLVDADHTFSSRNWTYRVSDATVGWIEQVKLRLGHQEVTNSVH